MLAREMQAKDLWPVFGSKGIASEVLDGKRAISRDAAKKLGEMFFQHGRRLHFTP